MYQALWELNIVEVPDDAGLAASYDTLPRALKDALWGVQPWAIVDCTLLTIPQRMLSAQ